jgi:1,4-dihydroxy-2-naphthoyl-CoA synthase
VALAQADPVAMKVLKRQINAGYEMSHEAVMASELDTLGYFWTTEGCREGARAFFEKRDPCSRENRPAPFSLVDYYFQLPNRRISSAISGPR